MRAENNSILNKAYKFYNNQDYIGAALAFHEAIINHNSDTDIMNEAQYYKFKSAQKTLEKNIERYRNLIENHYIALCNPVHGPTSPEDIIWKNAENLNKTEIDILIKLGFKIIGPQNYLFPAYAFRDWEILKKIEKNFPKSKWGEFSAFEMIDIERGIDCIKIPYTIAKNAEYFLKAYPESHLKYDVYHILAYAYNDLTHCVVHNCFKYNNSNGPVKNKTDRDLISNCKYSVEYSKKALYYYELILNNKNKLLSKPFNKYDDTVYKKLKSGKLSNVHFYYSD